MFRVKQSQIGSPMLDGLSSPFNTEAAATAMTTKPTRSGSEKADILRASFKRRRRARRVAALVGANIRSTWF